MRKNERYVGRKFITEFIDREFDGDDDIIRDMITSSKMLKAYDLTPDTTGNISARVCGGMYIKAGGKSLDNLTPRDIVFVLDYDKGTNKVVVKGREEPSSETPMHWLIYKKFPRVGAIVHVHDSIVLNNIDIAKMLKIGITSKEIEYGTIELAEEVVDSLLYGDYIIIKNHGSLSVGDTLENATRLTIDIHKKILELKLRGKNEGNC